MKQESRNTNDIYEDLKKYGVNVESIRTTDPTGAQLEELRNGLADLIKAQKRQAFKINPLKIAIVPVIAFALGALLMYIGEQTLSGDSVAQSLARVSNIGSMFNPSNIHCAFQSTSCNIK